MAFSDDTNNIPQKNWGEMSSENPMGFLSGGEALNDLRARDPNGAERVESDARRKTMRALNALRIVAPLLGAIQERTPANGDKEAAKHFLDMVDMASKFAESVTSDLGMDMSNPKNFWIKNVLERICCEAFHDQWVEKGEVNLNGLINGAKMIAENLDRGEYERTFKAVDAETTVKISLIKAMSVLLTKMELSFDFFRNLDKESERVTRLIFMKAGQGALQICDPYAGENERAALFSVLIEEAAKLYSSSWISVGRMVCDSLDKMSDEQLESVLNSHKGGLPVTKVDEAFAKNFERMIVVTSKLIPQKNGGLPERISGK